MGRHYKIPRGTISAKAREAKREEEARRSRYETLNTKERKVRRLLIEYGMTLMDAVAHERTIDESKYAQDIVKIIGE